MTDKIDEDFEEEEDYDEESDDVFEKVQLRVQKAKKRDIGRNIVRIDADVMERMEIKTGDVISLMGKTASAGIAWPSYPQDNGLNIVRIDTRLRKNTSVSVDDQIELHKANAKVAKSVVLAPSNMKIRSNPRFESFVRRKMNNYPITINDTLFISIGISREITFKVISIRPKGVCIFNQDTILHISEKISEEDKIGISYVTYEDVGGLDKEIDRLREMVELPLSHPSLFKKLGIDPPKGVLLRGPPGCGKTLLAKAVANETEAHFISINGPEIMSKFYGESEKRLRKLFTEAEEKAPSIIFIDHIESLGIKILERPKEIEFRVSAQLIALMDGLHARGSVIVIGATNKPELLESALRRPGRFDREIEIGIPDAEARKDIFLIHTKNMPLEKEIIIENLAKITEGFTGADIAGVCREASMSALRRYLPQMNLDTEEIDPELLTQMIILNEDFKNGIVEINNQKENQDKKS